MSHRFTFIPNERLIDDKIFFKFKTKRVKNKNSIIKKSAYFLNLVRTYEEEDYDVFSSKSTKSVFAFDDINVIEITRNVFKELLVIQSNKGRSED